MEISDLRGRFLERCQQGGVDFIERGVDALLRDAEAGRVDAVEGGAEAMQRGIAVGVHGGDDVCGPLGAPGGDGAFAAEVGYGEALAGVQGDGFHGMPFWRGR